MPPCDVVVSMNPEALAVEIKRALGEAWTEERWTEQLVAYETALAAERARAIKAAAADASRAAIPLVPVAERTPLADADRPIDRDGSKTKILANVIVRHGPPDAMTSPVREASV
jgi:hypothetical protein